MTISSERVVHAVTVWVQVTLVVTILAASAFFRTPSSIDPFSTGLLIAFGLASGLGLIVSAAATAGPAPDLCPGRWLPVFVRFWAIPALALLAPLTAPVHLGLIVVAAGSLSVWVWQARKTGVCTIRSH